MGVVHRGLLHDGSCNDQLLEPEALATGKKSRGKMPRLFFAASQGICADNRLQMRCPLGGVNGVAAGAGCVFLATLLVCYKEAFLGDEARFDDREDGVPW